LALEILNEKESNKSQMKQIDEEVGVAIGTVSIDLNGRGNVIRISKATPEKYGIQQANLVIHQTYTSALHLATKNSVC